MSVLTGIIGTRRSYLVRGCWLCGLFVAAVLHCLSVTATAADSGKSAAKGVKWVSYDDGLSSAKKDGRFVLIDFYTTICPSCKKMDQETFSDAGVAGKLATDFVPVKVDAGKQAGLASKYSVFAYPTFVILKPDGTVLCQRVGYMTTTEFLAFTGYASSGAYKTMGFKDYVKSIAKGK